MTLNELKIILESQPKDKVCKFGFGYPHAHRGYYDHVSFPPDEKNITVEQMLEYVNDALNHQFEGWKGGEYYYNRNTLVHFNFEGVCSMDDSDANIPENILKSILS